MATKMNAGEGEEEDGGEAGQHLHDRLRIPGQPRVHPDLDADRDPHQGGEDHQHHDPDQGEEAQPKAARELAKADRAVQIDEPSIEPIGNDRGHGAHEHEVARPPPGGIRVQRVFGQAERPGDAVQAPPDGLERPADRGRHLGPAEQVEHVALGRLGRLRRLDAELLGPGDERSPEDHVDADDHHDHEPDRDEHLAQVSVEPSRGHVGADSRKGIGVVGEGDRLRGSQEKPSATEAHHPVPDQADHRAGHIEPPERCPLVSRNMRAASSSSGGWVISE